MKHGIHVFFDTTAGKPAFDFQHDDGSIGTRGKFYFEVSRMEKEHFDYIQKMLNEFLEGEGREFIVTPKDAPPER